MAITLVCLLSGCSQQLQQAVIEQTAPPQHVVQENFQPPTSDDETNSSTELVNLETQTDPLRLKKITLDMQGSLRDVCTFLSIEGLTLILDEYGYAVPFTIRLKDKPIETLLEAVKITLGKQAQIIQREGYVYIGEPSDSDQAMDLFKLPGDAEEYARLFESSAGGGAKVDTQEDRLILRGSQDQLERARQLHRQLIKRRKQYIVDVVFAELTREQVEHAGIDITLSGAVELAIDGSKSLFTSGYDLAGVLNGLFSASGQRTNQAQWQSNRLFCVEGREAMLQIGDEIAIRRRVTTETGFIEETDTQIFNAGTQLKITVYGVDKQLIRVDLEPEISYVREYLDGVPTISTRKLTSSAYCAPDAIIVLGGQETTGQTVSGSTLPLTNIATNRNNRETNGRTFIFLQIKEVKGHQNHGSQHQETVSKDQTGPETSAGLPSGEGGEVRAGRREQSGALQAGVSSGQDSSTSGSPPASVP